MTLKGLGRGELTELMTNHGFGNEYRHMLAAIMYGKGVSNEIRSNHRTTRPSLNDIVRTLVVLLVDFLLQVGVDERACLLYTSDAADE